MRLSLLVICATVGVGMAQTPPSSPPNIPSQFESEVILMLEG
jgi:hypothetical protein